MNSKTKVTFYSCNGRLVDKEGPSRKSVINRMRPDWLVSYPYPWVYSIGKGSYSSTVQAARAADVGCVFR